MTSLSDRATRLTARVAPYQEAITAARAAGLTWADIARALGVQAPPAAVRQAVKRCRYEAAQIPLPEPQQAAQPPARTQVQPSQAQVASPGTGPAAAGKRLFDSIPKIGGKS